MFLKTIFYTGHFHQNNMVKLNQNQVVTFARIGWSVFPDSPGYSKEDFESLLIALSNVKGKFLMSSYPSDILTAYTKQNSWYTKCIEQKVSVANGTGKPAKKKIEVLTANYDLSNPDDCLTLFG